MKVVLICFLCISILIHCILLWCYLLIRDDVSVMRKEYLDFMKESNVSVNDTLAGWKLSIDQWQRTIKILEEILQIDGEHNDDR